MVYGPQERDTRRLKIFVLLRSTVIPSTNLSVVIDDIEMRITHVSRPGPSDEYAQAGSTLRIRGKCPPFRSSAVDLAPNKGNFPSANTVSGSLTTYRDRGFVPAAFRNFLASWMGAGRGKEILSVEDGAGVFLEQIHRSPAISIFRRMIRDTGPDEKALMGERRVHSHHADRTVVPLVKATASNKTLARGI